MHSIDISALVGTRLETVEFWEPANWSFAFSDGTSLRAECLWRVVVDARIAVTAEDNGQAFGLAVPVDAAERVRAATATRLISGAQVLAGTGDIVLQFGPQVRIDVIVNSSGYESWDLVFPDGRRFVALGGGEVAPITGAA